MLENLQPNKLTEFYSQVDTSASTPVPKTELNLQTNYSTRSNFRRTNNHTFSSTRKSSKPNVTEPLTYYSTLNNLNSIKDKENLLTELDLNIKWDTYLTEKGNVIDDFQALIQAAEIY